MTGERQTHDGQHAIRVLWSFKIAVPAVVKDSGHTIGPMLYSVVCPLTIGAVSVSHHSVTCDGMHTIPGSTVMP